MTGEPVDLGSGHTLRFVAWAPDRDLNPQYDGIPDVERYGANIAHTTLDGEECEGFVTFDSDVARQVTPGAQMWQVECWEPLTLSPSVLCTTCGDHGYVQQGRWIAA